MDAAAIQVSNFCSLLGKYSGVLVARFAIFSKNSIISIVIV